MGIAELLGGRHRDDGHHDADAIATAPRWTSVRRTANPSTSLRGNNSSRITQRCVAEFGGRIVLHFLPPYSPDSNRIERVWLDLHANVTRNHRRASIADLMRDVVDFLHAYNHRERRNPAVRRQPARRRRRGPLRESRSVI